MNKLYNSDIPSGCIMQFIKHSHSLNVLLTRSMKPRIAISPSELKPALHFLSLVQSQQTKVCQSSRHAESYLNFPSHLGLKIMFILLPALAHRNSLQDSANHKYHKKSNWQSWDDLKCLVLSVDSIINRRQKNLIQKDRERKHIWMIMMSKL